MSVVRPCTGTLGSKPWWMSQDQYEASGGPCACLLPAGHDGPHACEHEPVEWGVEVWPDTDSPWNRVDQFPSKESAEAALRDAYGSETRLVWRLRGGQWQPSDDIPPPKIASVSDHASPRT